jgi:hypothetical protein
LICLIPKDPRGQKVSLFYSLMYVVLLHLAKIEK